MSALVERTGSVHGTRRRIGLRQSRVGWDLVTLGVLALGWFALVAWTAVGPASWQAGLCAGLQVQPRACEAVRTGKDEARVIPHVGGERAPS